MDTTVSERCTPPKFDSVLVAREQHHRVSIPTEIGYVKPDYNVMDGSFTLLAHVIDALPLMKYFKSNAINVFSLKLFGIVSLFQFISPSPFGQEPLSL